MEAIEQGIAKDGDEMPNSNMWISQLFLWGMSSAWTDRMQSHFEYKYLVSQLSIEGLHLKVLQLALLDGSKNMLPSWPRGMGIPIIMYQFDAIDFSIIHLKS
jgi:hypothetical protein